jgi:hypothetical protein
MTGAAPTRAGLTVVWKVDPARVGDLGGATLTSGAREFAAVLAVGEGAFLSHHSAAYRLSLLPYPAHYPEVEITTTRRGPATRSRIRVHRVAKLASGETLVLDGLPLTTVRRTLLDLATVASDRDLERALATTPVTPRVSRSGCSPTSKVTGGAPARAGCAA